MMGMQGDAAYGSAAGTKSNTGNTGGGWNFMSPSNSKWSFGHNIGQLWKGGNGGYGGQGHNFWQNMMGTPSSVTGDGTKVEGTTGWGNPILNAIGSGFDSYNKYNNIKQGNRYLGQQDALTKHQMGLDTANFDNATASYNTNLQDTIQARYRDAGYSNADAMAKDYYDSHKLTATV